MSKILNTRIQQKYDTEANWKTLNSEGQPLDSVYIPLDGEVIIYGQETAESPNVKIGNGVNTLEQLPFLAYEKQLEKVPYPSVIGSYTYNGSSQTVQLENYDLDKMFLHSSKTQTNAGEYELMFELNEGYCWEDGSTEIYVMFWTIDKAPATLTLSETFITLTDDNGPTDFVTLTYTTNSTGSVTVTSDNDNIYAYPDIDPSYRTIYIYPIEKINGNATITVTVAATQNYNEVSGTIYVETDFMEVDSVLENNSWETIATVASNGDARLYWSVGAEKTIEGDYKAFILDFYNSGYGIQFCMYRDNYWYPECRCILGYARYFEEVIGTGEGTQWDISTIRRVLNNDSSGVYYGYQQLPEDLKPHVILTTNYSSYQYGTSTSYYSAIVTEDHLYLPSEVEVLGASSANYALDYDKQMQTQFEYFAVGNSKQFYEYGLDLPVDIITRSVRMMSDWNGSFIAGITVGDVGSGYVNIDSSWNDAGELTSIAVPYIAVFTVGR